MKSLFILFQAFAVVTIVAAVVFGQEFDPLDPSDDDAQTGIAVGESIPAFSAVDQNGERWDFDRLKGPNGAVLVFHRSADW